MASVDTRQTVETALANFARVVSSRFGERSACAYASASASKSSFPENGEMRENNLAVGWEKIGKGNLRQTQVAIEKFQESCLFAGTPSAKAPTVALAYSGGLDSRLLASLLRDCGLMPLLFHVFGPHSIMGTTEAAVRWAAENDLPIVCLPFNPLEIPAVRANGQRRCYYCKYALFSRIASLLAAAPLPLCDGTLASDLKTYRPGLQALRELGVISPLALAGFDKPLVSLVAKHIGLDRPEQLSQSCLITRFGYDIPLSEEKLRAMALADQTLEHYWEKHYRCAGCAPAYQSLRLVTPNSLEWHLEGTSIPLGDENILQERVAMAAPSLPPLQVRQVVKVKGFFDQPPS